MTTRRRSTRVTLAPKSGERPGEGTRRKGGRPSKLDAAQLSARILDAATDLFFTRGFGATSIEAVARRARISKRTFYHRFDDKAALFGAVLHRVIEGLRPPAAVPLLEGMDLHDRLHGLADILLHAALTPRALALHRLIVAESAQFPKLAAAVTAEGGKREAITLIADLLSRETRAGHLTIGDPLFAAEQFLQMVICIPQRRALGLEKPLTRPELDRWTGDVVDLFINGCRGGQTVPLRPA